MIHKLTIAAMLLGLLMPAVASDPEPPQPQINTYPDGFFFSSGRSYLGVEVKDITSDRVSVLKLKEERGVEIAMVDQDAPAGKAGLKEHDVVLEYNGARVESAEQFQRLIRETPPGRNVTLGISRDGNPMNITAQIGDRTKLATKVFKFERPGVLLKDLPSASEFNMPFDVQVWTYTPSLGIQVDNLGQQLGEFFGAKNGEGLLVKSVEKGGPAEKAGLKAGDVITRMDNEKISDRSDLRRLLRSHHDGGKVTLGIIREKHEQNLTIDLPAHKSGGSSGMEIWEPDMENWQDWQSKLQDIQPQLLEAQKTLQNLGPALQKNMAQFASEMRKAAKGWQIEFHDFI
jgi:serine protease Do